MFSVARSLGAQDNSVLRRADSSELGSQRNDGEESGFRKEICIAPMSDVPRLVIWHGKEREGNVGPVIVKCKRRACCSRYTFKGAVSWDGNSRELEN